MSLSPQSRRCLDVIFSGEMIRTAEKRGWAGQLLRSYFEEYLPSTSMPLIKGSDRLNHIAKLRYSELGIDGQGKDLFGRFL